MILYACPVKKKNRGLGALTFFKQDMPGATHPRLMALCSLQGGWNMGIRPLCCGEKRSDSPL